MIISDKQELKRCLKQAVRRSPIVDTRLLFDVQRDAYGIEALIASGLERSTAAMTHPSSGQTRFGADAAAVYAALDALNLPVRDLRSATTMQQSYDKNAWIREVLDALRANRVLCAVSSANADQTLFEDDRLAPMILAEPEMLKPGRYGVNYEAAAQRIEQALRDCNARDILVNRFSEHELAFCLMPVCEDTHAVLHVDLNNAEEIAEFSRLLDTFPGVRAVVSADDASMEELYSAAACRTRMLVQLRDPCMLPRALEKLGTRVLAYRSNAPLPEMMLGRWINAKETIWQMLLDAYLPLARAGYVLEKEAIEQDVAMLMGGSLNALYI